MGALHNSNLWFLWSEKALVLGMVMAAEVLKETVLQEQKIVIIRGFGYFSVEWVNIKFMHDAETKN